MDSGSKEIAFDCSSFRLHMDGRVDRNPHRMETMPAGFDAATGVDSKDVVIDAATGATVRLYLPPLQGAATTKLPILVFFHGGYFIVGSAAEPMYHRYVNSLVARARVVAVSVEYRLAPEHPLPAAYDDSWTALEWAVSRADPWLSDHGDLGRVFLAGVSAGGNIVHNMAAAVGASGLPAVEPARVEGVIELHPSFSGEQKMEVEDEAFFQANNDRWKIIFPGATGGVDDPRINPTADGAPSLTKLAGQRLLVCTASEDPRAQRARAYCDAVRASGWRGKAEWFESEGEGHGFFVLNPGTSTAAALMDRVVAFLAGH
ncbi:2-hydroxyisoflavanone dehydratase-like [Panicum miliaceum]|uniref:2-hydroxyisoflavanone dehydratase-like n=1 Tax=Panicum miliaceum TaxID=4540 RepID=A0A3L6QWC1_PANMI|nr:2-hydroxyisoflavanone dehydratase-like [Panicum miliaceum]